MLKTKKNDAKVLANTGFVENNPADEAKIEGNTPDYEIKETSLEYLQSLKIPEINLAFETNNSKLELPSDVKDILNSHWKAAIKFFYEEKFNKTSKSQESPDRLKTWAVYCGKTDQKLQKLFIEAPNGKRNISQTEAEELYGFLNKVAVKIVNKTRSIEPTIN